MYKHLSKSFSFLMWIVHLSKSFKIYRVKQHLSKNITTPPPLLVSFKDAGSIKVLCSNLLHKVLKSLKIGIYLWNQAYLIR